MQAVLNTRKSSWNYLEVSSYCRPQAFAGLSLSCRPKTLAQVFSCEFCEISKNTFFTEHLWTTASLFSRRDHTARTNFIMSELTNSF